MNVALLQIQFESVSSLEQNLNPLSSLIFFDEGSKQAKAMDAEDARIRKANEAILRKQATFDNASQRLEDATQRLTDIRPPKRPRTGFGESEDKRMKDERTAELTQRADQLLVARDSLRSTVEKERKKRSGRGSGKERLLEP